MDEMPLDELMQLSLEERYRIFLADADDLIENDFQTDV